MKSHPKSCATPRCRRETHGGNRFCSRCMMRRWRAANPIRAVFQCRRHKARRRGIDWELTLEEFQTFCERTGYLEKLDTHQLDRIDFLQPYRIDNLQILPRSENARKGCFEKHYGHSPAPDLTAAVIPF